MPYDPFAPASPAPQLPGGPRPEEEAALRWPEIAAATGRLFEQGIDLAGRALGAARSFLTPPSGGWDVLGQGAGGITPEAVGPYMESIPYTADVVSRYGAPLAREFFRPVAADVPKLAEDIVPTATEAAATFAHGIGQQLPTSLATMGEVAAYGVPQGVDFAAVGPGFDPAAMASLAGAEPGTVGWSPEGPSPEHERLWQEQKREIGDWVGAFQASEAPSPAQVPTFASITDAPREEWARRAMLNVGGNIGSLTATMVPTIAAGVVGGPVGAATILSGLASYVQNVPDIYQELRDAGVSREEASRTSMLVGVPIAALDVKEVEWALKSLAKLGGRGGIRGFVGTWAENALKEVPTEMLQEGIQHATTQLSTGKPVTEGLAERLGETAWATLTGVAPTGLGGVHAFQRARGRVADEYQAEAVRAEVERRASLIQQELAAQAAQLPPPPPPPPAPEEIPADVEGPGVVAFHRTPTAGDFAEPIVERLVSEGKTDVTEDVLAEMVPEEQQGMLPEIVAEVSDRLLARRSGQEFLSNLNREYGQGPDGVQVVDVGPDSQLFLQRKAGVVVGAARADNGVRTFIAGGRVVGSAVSARPLYEAMNERGIAPSSDLSPYGAAAQEREAARVRQAEAERVASGLAEAPSRRAPEPTAEEGGPEGIGPLAEGALPAPAGAVAEEGLQLDTFYSQLERVAAKLPQAMPIPDVRRYLLGKGVKQEELDESGVSEWLRTLPKNTRVTKAQLVQKAIEGRVALEETRYGGWGPRYWLPDEREQWIQRWEKAARAGKQGTFAEGEIEANVRLMRQGDNDDVLRGFAHGSLESTQYNDLRWQTPLPGNYGEAVVRIPPRKGQLLIRDEKTYQMRRGGSHIGSHIVTYDLTRLTEQERRMWRPLAELYEDAGLSDEEYQDWLNLADKAFVGVTEDVAARPNEISVEMGPGQFQRYDLNRMSEEDRVFFTTRADGIELGEVRGEEELRWNRLAERAYIGEGFSGRTYQGGHYSDVTNPLGFYRHKSVFLPDPNGPSKKNGVQGYRTLLIEEIQSDLNNEIRFELKQAKAAEERLDTIEAETHREAAQRLQGLLPFSENWHEKIVQRVLMHAAQAGFDRVAWTTGEIQVERWDLSKAVSSVSYDPKSREFYAYKDGQRVLSRGNVTAGELPKLIGQELADKLLSAPLERKFERHIHTFISEEEATRAADALTARSRDHGVVYEVRPSTTRAGEHDVVRVESRATHTLSGLDLTIGGEGRRTFYDEILPQTFAKATRKHGVAAPAQTKANVTGMGGLANLAVEKPGTWSAWDRDETPKEFKLERQARAYAHAEGGDYAKTELISLHYLDLSQQARQKIMAEGYALFEEPKFLPDGKPYKDPKTRQEAKANARKAAEQLSLFGKWLGPPLRGLDAGRGVRTLYSAITLTRELLERGETDFRGKRVGNVTDLAVIANVIRDPRFETFRFFAVKDGKIVGHQAVSSRVPGSVQIWTKNWRGEMAALRDWLTQLGADGYYMLHNHPSGVPEPSKADIHATRFTAANVPGFLGHVVIDATTFASLEPHPQGLVQRLKDLPPGLPPDRYLVPSYRAKGMLVEAEQLPITDIVTAAVVGRELGRTTPDSFILLTYVSSTGQLRGVQEMPVSLFADPKKAARYIREQQVAFGSPYTFAYHKGGPKATALAQTMRTLMQQGALVDGVIGRRSEELQQPGTYRPATVPVGRYRVGEEGRRLLEEQSADKLLKAGVSPAAQARNRLYHQRVAGRETVRGKQYAPKPPANEAFVGTVDGKPFILGRVSYEQWLERARAWIPKLKDWQEARQWYKKLRSVFEQVYGAEDAPRYLLAWAQSQQAESPTGGVRNVHRALDWARGIKVPKRGGLAHEKMVATFLDQVAEKGLAQKLADFVDASFQRETRTWLGDDPTGGRATPVDIHAGRDVGFVDQIAINYAKKVGMPWASRLTADFKATPGNPKYEYGIEFYQGLTDWLNENKVDGGDWLPEEAQAVGWTAIRAMVGIAPETPRTMFERNTRSLAIEFASFATGSPYEARFKDFTDQERLALQRAVVRPLAEEAASRTGVRIVWNEGGEGLGGFEGYVNPNWLLRVIGSPEQVEDFLRFVSWGAQQTEGYATRFLASGKTAARVYEVPRGATPEAVGRVYAGIVALNPKLKNLGYTHIRTDKGDVMVLYPGSSLSNAAFGRLMRKNHDSIASGLHKVFGLYSGGYHDERVDSIGVSNDWKKEPSGAIYEKGLRARGRDVAHFVQRAEATYGRAEADIRAARAPAQQPAPEAAPEAVAAPEGAQPETRGPPALPAEENAPEGVPGTVEEEGRFRPRVIEGTGGVTLAAPYNWQAGPENLIGFATVQHKGQPRVVRLLLDEDGKPYARALEDETFPAESQASVERRALAALETRVGGREFPHADAWRAALANQEEIDRFHEVDTSRVAANRRASFTRVKEEGVFEPKDIPTAVDDAFDALAMEQRGKPESAMMRVQFALGGGTLHPLVEYVGDLTHRFAQRPHFFRGQIGWDKVRTELARLRHPYGFAREHAENMKNNARARGVPLAEFKARLDALLKAYADEHRKLVVFNELQYHAREAAVAVGEQRWARAERHLAWLERIDRQGAAAREQAALEYTLGPDGKPEPYAPEAAPEGGVVREEGVFGAPLEQQRAGRRRATTPPPAGGAQPTPQPTGQRVLGRDVLPGESPRVEHKVARVEQLAPSVRLARDAPRTWLSLDPKIQDKLDEFLADQDAEERFLQNAGAGRLNDVDVMVLDALVAGRAERAATLRAQLDAARQAGTATNAQSVQYLEAAYDQAASELAKAAIKDVNAGTRLGRALAARRRVMEAARQMTPAEEFIRRLFRDIHGITEAEAIEAERILRQEPHRLADFLIGITKPGWFAKLIEFRNNAMVSAPSTLLGANPLGNFGMAVMGLAETSLGRPIEKLIDKIVPGGPQARQSGEARIEARASLAALPDAMSELLTKLADIRTQQPETLDLSSPLEQQTGAIGKGWIPGIHAGRLVRMPYRTLGAVDVAAKDIAGAQEFAKQLWRIAGGNRATFNDLMAHPELLTEEQAARVKKAVDAVKLERTGQDPNEIASLVINARRKLPALHLLVPFVQFPANITRYAWRRLPQRFFWSAWKSIGAYKAALRAMPGLLAAVRGTGDLADQRRAAIKENVLTLKNQAIEELVRPLVGTMILTTVYLGARLAMLGMSGGDEGEDEKKDARLGITGYGPPDPQQRDLMLQTGWLPYSPWVRLPSGRKLYFPINRLEPVATIIGIAADMAEARDAKTGQELADRALGTIIENFQNKNFLAGLAQTVNLMQDPFRFGTRFLMQLAGSFVPNVLVKTGQIFDPSFHEARAEETGVKGFVQSIARGVQSRVPGLSQQLPERVGVTGIPKRRPGWNYPGGGIARAVSPIVPSLSLPPEDTELERMMLRSYIPPEQRRRLQIAGRSVPLTDAEMEVFTAADVRAATQLRNRLPSLKRLPDTKAEAWRMLPVEEGIPGKVPRPKVPESKESVIRDVYARERMRAKQTVMRQPGFLQRARERE